MLRSIPNLGYGHMTKKTFVFKKNHGGRGAHGDDFGGKPSVKQGFEVIDEPSKDDYIMITSK